VLILSGGPTSGQDAAWGGTTVLPWVPGSATYESGGEVYYAGYGWYPGTTYLNPGGGFWIITTNSATITFVGTVQTANTNSLLANKYNLTSSAYPASLDLVTLGLTGVGPDDTVLRYSNTSQSYIGQGTVYYQGYGWYDATLPSGGPVNGPTLNVGEAFFYINSSPTLVNSWVQNFTIQ